MEQSQDLAPKGHNRTRSAAKAARPRSSTKGPLDADENPLSAASLAPSSLQSSAAPPPSPGYLPRSPAHPSTSASSLQPRQDFSFLLRPEIYHPLTTLSIPPPFRSSPKQPSPSTPLPDLFARGHYRAAAIAAQQSLLSPTLLPTDHAAVFALLYARLAALCASSPAGAAVAAQESRALEDLGGARYYAEDAETGAVAHVAPWPLRVLAVRLQALGFGDQRRAVMAYYELAREARARLRAGEEVELWRERLGELGVRVAGALLELGDLTGAAEHLASLKEEPGRMAMARALLWLQIGDVDAARACVRGKEAAGTERTVDALCAMADGEYGAALEIWEELGGRSSDDEMIGVNTAVCLLYMGRMQEGKALLESLVETGHSSHTLLFNLATMYELCTERSRTLKTQLAETVAAMEEGPRGWEKANADFKL